MVMSLLDDRAGFVQRKNPNVWTDSTCFRQMTVTKLFKRRIPHYCDTRLPSYAIYGKTAERTTQAKQERMRARDSLGSLPIQ